MAVNLNTEFNNIVKKIDLDNKPNLFLHVCCAPCSSSVLERLYNYFNLFIIYYNPNINTKDEFQLRLNELEKLNRLKNYNIQLLYNEYNHNEFTDNIKGLENEPEGGKRCIECFKIRLQFSCDLAVEYIKNNNLESNTNYLCTTLSVSPHKNAQIIEEIGESICKKHSNIISYLPSDFKKENGYLKSIVISKELGLYRQNYCGCEFSMMHN